jgi:hypothetical protein
MTCDGFQQQIDGLQVKLEALRAIITTEAARHNGNAPSPRALLLPATRRTRPEWTDARRKAQAKRMREAWKTGRFSKNVGRKKPTRAKPQGNRQGAQAAPRAAAAAG